MQAALAAIDAVNAQDPNRISVDGVLRPKELVHAELMCRTVRELDPGATDEQILAASAHHLRRWAVPRSEFPPGRAGYLRWRAQLRRRHADEVADILRDAGYEEPVIERVQQIVRKEGLAHDPQVQVHEDALCLVFLQLQLEEYAEEWGDGKTVDILRKTAAKMSPSGLAAAAQLPLTERAARLLETALAG